MTAARRMRQENRPGIRKGDTFRHRNGLDVRRIFSLLYMPHGHAEFLGHDDGERLDVAHLIAVLIAPETA